MEFELSKILQPSLIAKLLERGHVAMVTRLAKKGFRVVASPTKVKTADFRQDTGENQVQFRPSSGKDPAKD